jgi:hypothetical protein
MAIHAALLIAVSIMPRRNTSSLVKIARFPK